VLRPPPPPPDDDVDRSLAELSALYAAELPGLIQRLDELAAGAARSPDDARAVRVAAHRLRGTAGSYGFPAVGEAAGRIEDALEGDLSRLPELVRALVLLSPAGQTASAGSSGSSK
jgi:HPt (histidine-containing phosphotransfer) domain-containing protein